MSGPEECAPPHGAFAYLDPNQICRFASAGAAAWFGRPAGEIAGLDLASLLGAELYASERRCIEETLQGRRQEALRRFRDASGGAREHTVQYTPEIGPKGQVLGFYLALSDPAEGRGAPENLVAANAELVRARDAAEAAASAQSEFLSNMSHELRTPLTSIIGFSDILARRSGPGGPGHEYVMRIRSASQALLSTVNDILDFSKLEAGRIEIERRPVDPEALARTTLDLFEPQATYKTIYRRLRTRGLCGPVLADAGRLRQILLNYLGNAMKFTGSGGVTLEAGYDQVLQTLRFSVTDTGPGIPEDRLPLLFERFSQIAGPGQTFGGAGLGLSICRGLAEAMGGRVGVDSVLGVGSCFWVEVPAAPAGSKGVEPDAAAAPEHLEALEGLRVLIVDDSSSNRELTRIITEPFGVACSEADGGVAAVQLAHDRPFDVILMDIRMPEVDGAAAAQMIRARPGPNQATPIVGFTADFRTKFPAGWKGLFSARVGKPIVPEELLATLASHSPGHAPVA